MARTHVLESPILVRDPPHVRRAAPPSGAEAPGRRTAQQDGHRDQQVASRRGGAQEGQALPARPREEESPGRGP
eukprot:1337299-Pyramimonas_sp.AAC.1